MATKEKVNKSKAVRDYLKANPGVGNTEVAKSLTKSGIKVTPNFVATIKSKLKDRMLAVRTKLKGRVLATKSAAAEPVTSASPTPAAAEKPSMPGDAITIEQIKAVGEMVRAVGGFGRFREMLDVIREVGGLKRLRDLLEAMSVTEIRSDFVPNPNIDPSPGRRFPALCFGSARPPSPIFVRRQRKSIDGDGAGLQWTRYSESAR